MLETIKKLVAENLGIEEETITENGSSVYLRIMMENLCRVYYNDCKCF